MKKSNSSKFAKFLLIVGSIIAFLAFTNRFQDFGDTMMPVNPFFGLIVIVGLMMISIVWRFPKNQDFSRIFCNIKN